MAFYKEVSDITLRYFRPADFAAMEASKAIILGEAFHGRTSALVPFNEHVEGTLKKEGFTVKYLQRKGESADHLEVEWKQ